MNTIWFILLEIVIYVAIGLLGTGLLMAISYKQLQKKLSVI